MRTIFLLLLMTATMATYAQSISVADLRALSSMEKQDSLNQYLSGKGYFSSNNLVDLSPRGAGLARTWKFTTGKKDEKAVSTIMRYNDTSSWQIGYRTVSPYIYSQVVNELIASGFNRIEAVASEQEVELIFSNGHENILLKTETRKTDPEFLIQYKRTGSKLIAYYAVPRKPTWFVEEPVHITKPAYAYPRKRQVTRKTAPTAPVRAHKQVPVQRYYYEEFND